MHVREVLILLINYLTWVMSEFASVATAVAKGVAGRPITSTHDDAEP